MKSVKQKRIRTPEPQMIFSTVNNATYYAWCIETKILKVLGDTKQECINNYIEARSSEEA